MELNNQRVTKFDDLNNTVAIIGAKIKPGELLYFYPEEMIVQVVMVGDEGFRYFEPSNMEFDDNGNIITKYAPFEVATEWINFLGNLSDIIEGSEKWKTLIGSKKDPQ